MSLVLDAGGADGLAAGGDGAGGHGLAGIPVAAFADAGESFELAGLNAGALVERGQALFQA